MRKQSNSTAIRRARMFGIGAVFFVIVVGVVLWSFKGEGLDSQGCPRETGPKREVVVLVDGSDPLNDKHKAELGRILRELTGSATSGRRDVLAMNEGERVTLYVMETTPVPLKIKQICHPGNPAERPWYEELIRGRLIADQHWRDFKTGLVDDVREHFPAVESEARAESPILETIAVITARHASSRRAEKGVESTHLIVISDLLQNTQMLSHYRPFPKPSDIPRELGSDLSRVHVSLFRLERHKYAQFQTPEHFYWWTDWVEKMEGKVVWQQAL